MLYSADKTLYVIRSLREEGLCQWELNLLFNSLVISKISYGLSVYGSSTSDLYTDVINGVIQANIIQWRIQGKSK